MLQSSFPPWTVVQAKQIESGALPDILEDSLDKGVFKERYNDEEKEVRL